MTTERTNGESPRKQFKELPIPKEGITTQIFSEILTDRTMFAKRELATMQRQNRPLCTWLIFKCMASPDRDLALDWALAYYTIHSRSTSSEGMPTVSTELISNTVNEENQRLSGLRDEEFDKEKVEEYRQERKDKIDRIVNIDCERSSQLKHYWLTIASVKESLKSSDYTEYDTENIFEASRELAILLHSQSDTNSLNKISPN